MQEGMSQVKTRQSWPNVISTVLAFLISLFKIEPSDDMSLDINWYIPMVSGTKNNRSDTTKKNPCWSFLLQTYLSVMNFMCSAVTYDIKAEDNTQNH